MPIQPITTFDKALVGPIATISGTVATYLLGLVVVPDVFNTPEMAAAISVFIGSALGGLATYIWPNKLKDVK